MKVGSRFVYQLAVIVCNVFFRVKGGISAYGLENIPKEGGYIVAANHVSHLDSPALACTMKGHRVLALAKAELFKNPIFGWLIRQIGAFPLKRGEGDAEAIKRAVDLLKDGHPVIVFPEGTRGDGVHLGTLSRGAVMLAKMAGVPILPIGIGGTESILPLDKTRKPKNKHVKVVFGRPFKYADLDGTSEKQNRQLFMTRLEQELLSLTAKADLPLLPPLVATEPTPRTSE